MYDEEFGVILKSWECKTIGQKSDMIIFKFRGEGNVSSVWHILEQVEKEKR